MLPDPALAPFAFQFFLHQFPPWPIFMPLVAPLFSRGTEPLPAPDVMILPFVVLFYSFPALRIIA